MMNQLALSLLTLSTLIVMCTSQLEAQQQRIPSKGFALLSKDGDFQNYDFTRHAVGDHDILIRTMYCGICHSDIHEVHGDWKQEQYPLVPGHEIVGQVVAVGNAVTKFRVGDYAGVGCMVNSCRHCEYCEQGQEQYCLDGRVLTYADRDIYHDGEMTQGGYSSNMVVDEAFAITLPKDAPLEKIGPLMCAGITTWSPIRACGVKAGDKVGVAGFGGLGHLAVKYLVSMGAEVTVFDITDDKRADALRLGARRYVNINNAEDMKDVNNTLTFILSTIPAKYDPMMYVRMLKVGGTLAVVGLPAANDTPTIPVTALRGRHLMFSVIGGIAETQEVVDYSLAHGIYPETVTIPADAKAIDQAYRNVQAGKVKFRYVIDLRSLQ